MNLFLNSIDVTPQPIHTKVAIACGQCDRQCTCAYQEDYCKLITLIQQVIGNPQEDREVITTDDEFTGMDFKDNSIFPQTIKVLATNGSEEIDGTFMSAKWCSKDKVKLLYNIESYYVMFVFLWDTQFEKYIYEIGKELYFGIQYTITENSANEIIEVLNTWREEIIHNEEENKDVDIINTTPFSASLYCKYYKQKNDRIVGRAYTNHNTDIEDSWKHIATYHFEKEQVRPAPLPNKPVDLAYPWFIPVPAPKLPKPKPKRRDEF